MTAKWGKKNWLKITTLLLLFAVYERLHLLNHLFVLQVSLLTIIIIIAHVCA
jgi:hypothetical protein